MGIYYHVVTNKPMFIGQEIRYDENNHSGVYERVYALKDKVDDIYNNPKKYENMDFDHHLKVALREFALEDVRQNKYPQYPSRLSSLYVSNTLEEAQKWYDLFIKLGRPTFQIVKVEAYGNVYIGDACNCFDGTIDKKLNLELAEDYWKYNINQKGESPIIEILVDGNIKVIDIVVENK